MDEARAPSVPSGDKVDLGASDNALLPDPSVEPDMIKAYHVAPQAEYGIERRASLTTRLLGSCSRLTQALKLAGTKRSTMQGSACASPGAPVKRARASVEVGGVAAAVPMVQADGSSMGSDSRSDGNDVDSNGNDMEGDAEVDGAACMGLHAVDAAMDVVDLLTESEAAAMDGQYERVSMEVVDVTTPDSINADGDDTTAAEQINSVDASANADTAAINNGARDGVAGGGDDSSFLGVQQGSEDDGKQGVVLQGGGSGSLVDSGSNAGGSSANNRDEDGVAVEGIEEDADKEAEGAVYADQQGRSTDDYVVGSGSAGTNSGASDVSFDLPSTESNEGEECDGTTMGIVAPGAPAAAAGAATAANVEAPLQHMPCLPAQQGSSNAQQVVRAVAKVMAWTTGLAGVWLTYVALSDN